MGYSDEQELEFSIERFTGIDQGMEGNDTPMSCARYAFNCDASGGMLRLAPGWAKDTEIRSAAPGEIKSLMNFYKKNADGSETAKLVAATDGGLWLWNGRAWEDIAGANPVTSGRFSHVNYQKGDKALLIMANGTDNAYCWAGTGKAVRLAVDAPWVQGQPMWDESSNTIRLNRHGMGEDGKVVFDKYKGELPTNISENDTYFVYDAKPDTFRVSATKAGGPVNLKGKGKVGWRMAAAKWLIDATPTVDTDQNTIRVPAHGLLPDEAVVFDHFTGSLPGGISANTVYYVIVESTDAFGIAKAANDPDSAVNITSAGSGEWRVRKAELEAWLPGAPTASHKTNTFTLTNHGLKRDKDTPLAVEFGVEPSAVLPGGISAGKTYYLRRFNADNFYLTATTEDDAKTMDILDAGSGGWSIKGLYDEEWRGGSPTVNVTTNAFTLEGHGFADKAPVVFGVADENSYMPDGLYAGHTYYVKRIDGNRFMLSPGPASDNVADITSGGLPGWAVKRLGAAVWLATPSADPETDVITIAAHGLIDAEAVTVGLDESRILPGGLAAGRRYYVRDVQVRSFKLAATANGNPIDLTSVGRIGWRIRPENGVWRPGLPWSYSDTNQLCLNGHGFKNNDAVILDLPNADGFMPGGITAHNGTPQGKFYYVVNATDSTFMVSETAGGTPVKLLNAGTKAFRVRISRENRPMGNSLALHCERVWCAGERSQPNSVFFSDDSNPSNWAIGADAAGAIAHPTWDGDAVTAVANLFDSVTVFKKNSMFRVAGTSPDEYQVAPLPSTVGTLSPATICQWQNAAFFLSPRGIMAFDGTGCTPVGGEALKDFYSGLNTSREALAGACAVVHGDRLLVALAAGKDEAGRPVEHNNTVVEFDLPSGTFMLRKGVAVSCWLPGEKLRFGSGRDVCIWGEDTAGNAVHSYGGEAIAMRWETPQTDMGSRTSLKTVAGITVTGKGGAFAISVTADGRTWRKTVALPADGGTVRAGFLARGRMLSFAFENVEGSNVEISGVTVAYEREDG